MDAKLNDARLPVRFWAKIAPEPNGGCWLWLASLDRGGYGKFRLGQRMRVAHRVAYEALAGDVPLGSELDHLCRTPSCVNPAHLEPVTHTENMRRSPIVARAGKETCRNGHPYGEANTYVFRGFRYCRACNRGRVREYTSRKQAVSQ